jgi:diguanylate cyclase (GGDEF)-like protein
MATILCIEDEPQLRTDMAEILVDAEHNVLLASDGQHGLEMILEHEPDLVVSDITMPNISGHDLVRILREKYPRFAETPFIFLSALADREDVLDGIKAGADCYLTKPVEFDLLLGQIECSLRQVNRMRARTKEQLIYMAHHDALTELPNRVLLKERIEQALQFASRGQSFAILFLDLDRFKTINDTLGHLVGDELLKAVAGRLRGCVREADTIARMGGDEFAIIQLLSQQPQAAIGLAQRIGEALRSPFDLKDNQVVVDASIGIAVAPDHGTDPNQLLNKADIALYRAKRERLGQYRVFEAEMDGPMLARRKLELDLRQALEKSEFVLHYQPLVNLETGHLSSFEALLRWNHPERGLVAPDDFIPIAEKMGMIIPIGEWVIRTACEQAKSWPASTRVAVNLSPEQFRGDHLVQTVFRALANSGIAPSRLELEITEGLLLQDDQSTLEKLYKLRNLGVSIVMDDFGAGYSSLGYLKRFPFDKIKLDRSLVVNLPGQKGEANIIEAVAKISDSFGMATTAEGVETEQQFEIVKRAGYTEMQGYLFSPPLNAEEISEKFFGRAVSAGLAAFGA